MSAPDPQPDDAEPETARDAGYFDIGEWGDKQHAAAVYAPGTVLDIAGERVHVDTLVDRIGRDDV